MLHTWGSAMTHHPHVHMIVPAAGSPQMAAAGLPPSQTSFSQCWCSQNCSGASCSRKLTVAHAGGKLRFFGAYAHLADQTACAAFLAPMKRTRWFVYSKRPFAGPQAVLAYLSRYTNRVAISNRRLIAVDANSATFKVKDYRIEGPGRYRSMTLEVAELIRRFLPHVLPKGFHRSATTACSPVRPKPRRSPKLATSSLNPDTPEIDEGAATAHTHPCPCCGGRMLIVELFEPGSQPQHQPINPKIRMDTS
ncbi:MAG: transposase [Hyphomicrobiaceae bacterium]